MYIFQCYFLSSSYLLLHPLCPEVSSLCLNLYSCLAKTYIRTIFYIPYICNTCFFSLSDLLNSVMLKNLQVRLQQYMNCELPDVQPAFRKGRGIRDQTANICWIIQKTRELKKIYVCFIDYAKAFECVDHNKLGNSERDGNTRPPDLPLEKPVCMSGSNSENWTWNNRLVPNGKKSTSRLYIVTLVI